MYGRKNGLTRSMLPSQTRENFDQSSFFPTVLSEFTDKTVLTNLCVQD